MKEIITDIREFIKENRNVIYWVIAVLLLDHFIFEGKFREKIKNVVEGCLNKVEKQINKPAVEISTTTKVD